MATRRARRPRRRQTRKSRRYAGGNPPGLAIAGRHALGRGEAQRHLLAPPVDPRAAFYNAAREEREAHIIHQHDLARARAPDVKQLLRTKGLDEDKIKIAVDGMVYGYGIDFITGQTMADEVKIINALSKEQFIFFLEGGDNFNRNKILRYYLRYGNRIGKNTGKSLADFKVMADFDNKGWH
jgi:hypothetical protein